MENTKINTYLGQKGYTINKNEISIEKQKQKDREMKYNALMATLWMMGSLCIVIPLCTILFQLITVKHL